MLGLLFAGISRFFGELNDSLSKRAVVTHRASYFTVGFLSQLSAFIFFLAIGIVRDDLLFSLASLPTFIPRVFFEILQAHLLLLAIMKADRSDFGPLRALTIPLLFAVDAMLGYAVSLQQAAGIFTILLAILLLLTAEHSRAKGIWLVIASAVNAVITISLYKYNITHFNSVEAEEGIIYFILMLFFFARAQNFGENPFKFLRKPFFIAQASASGLQALFGAFALAFASASVITAGMRAFSILFAILAGRVYFNEKHIVVKTLVAILIVLGLALLAF